MYRRFAMSIFGAILATFLATPSAHRALAALPTIDTLHTFNEFGDGWQPDATSGRLLLGSDGNFYGTTTLGGPNNDGTIYRITPSGVFTTLYSFTYSADGVDGVNPACTLIEESYSHYLYGITTYGGMDNAGTIFKIAMDGTNYSQIYSFISNDYEYPPPKYPEGGLVEGPGHVLYGMASGGGANFEGAFYKINADGQAFKDIYDISGSRYGGTSFVTAPILVNNTLYECCLGLQDSAYDQFSCIDSIQMDGTGFNVIQGNAGGPTGLCYGGDGYFYWTAGAAGQRLPGGIFRMPITGGAITELYTFDPSVDGASLSCTLCTDGQGNFYGSTPIGPNTEGLIFKYNVPTSTYTILSTLNTGTTAVTTGSPGPIIGADGNLYGTQSVGGIANYGTIYRQSTTPAPAQIIYQFGNGLFDGSVANAPLVVNPDHSIVGSTNSGGVFGSGTIYKLSSNGAYSVVDEFDDSTSTNPYGPVGGFTPGSAGQLFGLVQYGGSSECGELYALLSDNSIQPVFSFQGAYGRDPIGNPVIGSDGYFYCVTNNGGIDNAGTLDRITPDGSHVQLVHMFTGMADGETPTGLIGSSDGNLYGTCYYGGSVGDQLINNGVIFKYQLSTGKFSILHTFVSTDGAHPGPLMEASDGMLYGMNAGYQGNSGAIYKIAKTAGDTFHVMDLFDGTTRGGWTIRRAHPRIDRSTIWSR